MADKTFLGTGWSFPPEFKKNSGQVLMVSEDEDIEDRHGDDGTAQLLGQTAPQYPPDDFDSVDLVSVNCSTEEQPRAVFFPRDHFDR